MTNRQLTSAYTLARQLKEVVETVDLRLLCNTNEGDLARYPRSQEGWNQLEPVERRRFKRLIKQLAYLA